MPAPSRISGCDAEGFPDGVPWGELRYGILEAPWSVAFVTDPRAGGVSPGQYPCGMLFGESAAIHWKRLRSGKFRFVCIRDDGEALPGTESAELVVVDAEEEGLPEQIVLWGEAQTGVQTPEWYEPRIPRTITEYPGEFTGERLALTLTHYRLQTVVPVPGGDVESGAALISRCKLLHAAPVEEDP